MGESICFVRSFSQPAEFSSHQINNEVVPNRVLTESVSFGRFANETLAWERWSAFTQNRYLEEVERFTKPGSVAQKKAFFEAHFKNRASGKATQTKKIEEVKTGDEIVCEIPKDILVDSEVPIAVVINEVRHGEVSSSSVIDETTDVKTGQVENLKSVVVLEDNALDEENSTTLSKERPPSCSGSKVSSTKLEPSVVIELDHSLHNTRKESSSSSTRSLSVSKNRASGRVTQPKKIEEVETSDEIVCEIPKDILVDSEVTLVVSNGEVDETTDVKNGEEENLKSVVVLDEENSTSLSKERPPSCSGSKVSSTKLEPSVVIELDHSLKNTRKESSSSSTRSLSVLKNRSRSPAQPVHMSISCAPSGDTDKTLVGMPQNGAKSAGKADKKKRSGPSSVHMSLNSGSSARGTTKAAPKTLARNSTTQETTSSNARNKFLPKTNEQTGASKSHKRPFSQTSKEGFKAAKCSTSASSVTLPELPPLSNQLFENKRKNITVGKSISCRIPNNVQRQPPVSCENLSTHSRTKAKSLTVSSPFIFRSDERAEKRKEFFKKVEEKNKKENTGKDTFSCGFKANQNTNIASEEHKKASEEHKKNPQVGGFRVPPITMTSPRFRRNQTPGKENIKTPHKASSMKIINTKKVVMEKQKSSKIHPSSKPQATKKTQENMSPNILQN